MANRNIVEFTQNLQNAEMELRNRRLFEEADAVKLAREVVVPLMLDVAEKEKEAHNGTEGK